jgi:hypothetical protein
MSTSTPKRQTPLAGTAQGADLWDLQSFDVDRLRRDLAIATKGWNWERGCFGHSLPLTTRELSAFGATHYNNLVKSVAGEPALEAHDKLDECRYFREIFDSFHCEKSSFRILRRPAHSSYTLHRDNDMGQETYRFQIPIESNPDIRLLVSTTDKSDDFLIAGADYRKVEYWDAEGIGFDEVKSWFEEFVRLNEDKVKVYQTEPGKLYYFSTPSNYHNLWNFGLRDRFTLAIDLVGNEWLYKNYPVILDPVRPF